MTTGTMRRVSSEGNPCACAFIVRSANPANPYRANRSYFDGSPIERLTYYALRAISSRTRSNIDPVFETPRATLYRCDWLDVPRPADPIDFIYVDPPFNTGKRQRGRRGVAASYADSWDSPSDYIDWLRPRVQRSIGTLRESGSIMLHVDFRTSHHVRLLLDQLLGPDRFVNHLVWKYGLGGSSPRTFARKHDDILFYCLNPKLYYFNPPRIPATSRRMFGQTKKATDVLDIPALNNQALERTGYPTQKPLELLELLINAACPPGGSVMDPCCGSGTTLLASLNTGRKALGADISLAAVRIATKRLQAAQTTIERPEKRNE
jgi:site-specific DNA-methyltransferase (adenine-specific)